MTIESLRGAIFILPLWLATASAPALSENWRQMGTVDEAVGYLDVDSIKRHGDKVRFWRELRFAAPKTAPTGHRFDRMAALIEVHCRAKTFRYLRQRANLGDRVIHDAKDPNDSAHSIEPGTAIDAELRAVCSNDWPSGQ